MPKDPSFVKAIVVGGSTTECFFVTENKAWPQVFQQETRRNNPKFWVNNAGLNGHSTFGHLILLKDIIVKQKPVNENTIQQTFMIHGEIKIFRFKFYC